MTTTLLQPSLRPRLHPGLRPAPRPSPYPGLRAPGLGWLPAVWRRAATWKTVLRFVLLGPLIGGAPYVVFLFPIPFAYAIGALPALLAGWLFATWYHGAGRTPGWAWRATMGAMSGAATALASAVPFVLLAARPQWFMVWVVALHGVPAAVVLALLQRPARPRIPRPVETGPSQRPV
ncbi:MAG: hypothetical protein HZC37_17105 [Burkholderiales bacterium]|nr:hypothetical protein [Burkholderiales bacterium]